MGESPDASELARMAHMAGKGHVVFAATNSRGRGVMDAEYEVGDIGRLDRLAEMVQHRIVDVLAVCETKFKSEHLQCLHDALRRRGLVYRTGLVDDTASRGVIIIWRKDFPYVCSKVYVDGPDKRVVVVKFRGAKGTSLVVSCSYMENIGQPVEVQNKMYNFVGQHVPLGRSHKHMFIDMGDKNCVLNPCQRVPTRNRVQENNRPLLTFARKFGLTEVVTEDAGATTPIYTRVDNTEGSKAKLDHIHTNEAAYRAHSASGWTETNPVNTRSDHGIVWVALDPTIMQGIEPSKQEKREVIRTNGAKEVTHDKFPGCPMTLGGVHANNIGTRSNWKRARLDTVNTVASILLENGYDTERLTCSTRHQENLHADLRECERTEAERGIGRRGKYDTARATIEDVKQSIQWRNGSKEWWVYARDEGVAKHMASRGRGLPPLKEGQVRGDEMDDGDGTEWQLLVSGGCTVTKADVTKYIHDTLHVPRDEVQHIMKTQPSERQDNTWSVVFTTRRSRTFWASYGSSVHISDDARARAHDISVHVGEVMAMEYATGWKSYERRVGDTIENSERRGELGEGSTPQQMWNVLEKATTSAAKAAFGTTPVVGGGTHHKSHEPNRITSATYRKHLETIQRALIHRTTTTGSDATWGAILAEIPIPCIWGKVHGQTTLDDWRKRAGGAIQRLKKAYMIRKKAEINHTKAEYSRKLTRMYKGDIGRFLNETLGVPRGGRGGGAAWPETEEGEIHKDSDDRIRANREIYRRKTESRTAAPDLQTKRWLGELLQVDSGFSEEDRRYIEGEFAMEELQTIFRRIKKGTAPGPTGIVYAQWQHGSSNLQQLLLRMLNAIYETSDVPTQMRRGLILPIPKDPNLPCTHDNARPLTMLETGLKLMTHLIGNRITKCMSENPRFAPIQHAFLPGSNIMDAVHIVELTQERARMENVPIHQLFLDLTQAYDRLEFWASKMALDRLGLPVRVVEFFTKLDTGSTRNVATVDGVTTDWDYECGVPQGEVLSPLRFIAVMDMLATWLTLRCNGANPSGKRMGFAIRKPHDKVRCPNPALAGKSDEELRAFASMYCDDIWLVTDSAGDMQDLLGVVSEFMSTLGIPINGKKSIYTCRTPRGEPMGPIYTSGKWVGGLDGEWSAEPKDPVNMCPPTQAVRYLGVHFQLDGGWKAQHDILVQTLHKSLAMIKCPTLSAEQLVYILNAAIIPKVTYPLRVTGAYCTKYVAEGNRYGSHVAQHLDMVIRTFVRAYLELPHHLNKACYSTPKIGLGIHSIEDVVTSDIITNTMVSLNSWDECRYWHTMASGGGGVYKGMNISRLYAETANLFPTALLGDIDREMEANAYTSFLLRGPWVPKRWCGRRRKPLCVRIMGILSSWGYAIDTEYMVSEPRTTPHVGEEGLPIGTTMPHGVLREMADFMLKHSVWHMEDMLEPCGTRLRPWGRLAEEIAMDVVGDEPVWFARMGELVLAPKHPVRDGVGVGARVVKREYMGRARPTNSMHLGEVYVTSKTMEAVSMAMHIVTGAESREHGTIRTDEYTWRKGEGIEEVDYVFQYKGTATCSVEQLGRAHTYLPITPHTWSQRGDKVDVVLPFGVGNSRGVRLPYNVGEAVRTQIVAGQKLRKRQAHGTDTNWSDDSPPSDSDSEVKGGRIAPDYDTVSDGSMYLFGGAGRYCGGYAALGVRREERVTTRVAVGVGEPYGEVRLQCENEVVTTWTRQKLIPPREWVSDRMKMEVDPYSPSSYTVEAEGVRLAKDTLGDFKRTATGTRRHACDNQGVMKTMSAPGRRTPRERVRMQSRYALDDTGEVEVDYQWVKGHNGEWAQEKVDRHAARAAFRVNSVRPERFPPRETTLFHLYFGHDLVGDDVRNHVRTVVGAYRFQEWCEKGGQGYFVRLAKRVGCKLPNATGEGMSRWATSFQLKYINDVLATPHREHVFSGNENDGDDVCPLCGALRPDARHIILSCTHPRMVELREDMGGKLRSIVFRKEHVHAVVGQYTPHPIFDIPVAKLYPYAPDFPRELGINVLGLVREGLPEGRWYRKSKSVPGAITVHRPGDYTRPGQPRCVHVSPEAFWKLVAMHPVSHYATPMPRDVYEGRATDMFDAIRHASSGSGELEGDQTKQKMCWATHRDMLHILVEHVGARAEMFCNIMNTFHRFRSRRTLGAPRGYAIFNNFLEDGTDEGAYVGVVYANPPFDGQEGGSTVAKTLDIC